MSYDLGDALKWEFMFPNKDKPLVVIPDVNEDLLEVDDEEVLTPLFEELPCRKCEYLTSNC